MTTARPPIIHCNRVDRRQGHASSTVFTIAVCGSQPAHTSTYNQIVPDLMLGPSSRGPVALSPHK